jgi:hypothetical protein
MHLWWHYEYGGDPNFLQDVYPLMKGAAEFFVDFLVQDPRPGSKGYLLTNPTHSPEQPNPALRDDGEIVAGTTMDSQLIRSLFTSRSIPLDKIEAISISCVVPPMLNMLLELCEKYFSLKPLVVEFGVNTQMPILLDNPYEVGADRIVNAVAGYHKHRRSLIVVDSGPRRPITPPRGRYMGGAISPGLGISAGPCSSAKLPGWN